MELPSKELLSGVLDKEITYLKFIDAYDARLGLRPNDVVVSFEEYEAIYNAYELMHLMKVWAIKNNYIIKIKHHYENTHRILLFKNCKWAELWKCTFKTEFEAVTEACEWIRSSDESTRNTRES